MTTIPDTIDITPGREVKRIDAPGKATWVIPPGQSGLQVITYFDHCLVFVTDVGTYHVGAMTADRPSVEWCKIHATREPSPVEPEREPFVWPTITLPSMQTAFNVAAAVLMAGAILWGAFREWGPTPGPEPKPGPVVPVSDPLADALKFAWQMEFAPTKQQEAAGLVAVYRVGIASPAKTFGDLYAEIGAEAAKQGVAGKLPNVQKAINDELAKTLPNPTTQPELVIDDPSRALIRQQFARVVAALEKLK